MIEVSLNGKPRQMEGSQTITALLKSLNINPNQVAVAINGKVVRRDTWLDAVISERDAVEIVRAVGGG